MTSLLDRIFRRATVEDYEGVDVAQAQRMGSLLELVGLVAGCLLLIAAPPTARLGWTGWAITAALVLGAVCAYVVARLTESYKVGLTMAYIAVGEVALLEWLGGGLVSPYEILYALPLVYVAGVHPAPRLAAFLAVLAPTTALPAFYDGFGPREVAIATGQAALWVGLGTVIHLLMHRVRVIRLRLTRGEADARRLARLDSLTGLGNRRAFEESLEREAARSHRNRSPLALVVADLDGFKEINDRFGHSAGDECLRSAASALSDEVRLPDLCFRWGGDEFAVILPDTDRSAATLVAERVAAAVAGSCATPRGGPVTVSFGVAELDAEHTAQALVDEADRRLLARKRSPSESRPT